MRQFLKNGFLSARTRADGLAFLIEHKSDLIGAGLLNPGYRFIYLEAMKIGGHFFLEEMKRLDVEKEMQDLIGKVYYRK